MRETDTKNQREVLTSTGDLRVNDFWMSIVNFYYWMSRVPLDCTALFPGLGKLWNLKFILHCIFGCCLVAPERSDFLKADDSVCCPIESEIVNGKLFELLSCDVIQCLPWYYKIFYHFSVLYVYTTDRVYVYFYVRNCISSYFKCWK